MQQKVIALEAVVATNAEWDVDGMDANITKLKTDVEANRTAMDSQISQLRANMTDRMVNKEDFEAAIRERASLRDQQLLDSRVMTLEQTHAASALISREEFDRFSNMLSHARAQLERVSKLADTSGR